MSDEQHRPAHVLAEIAANAMEAFIRFKEDGPAPVIRAFDTVAHLAQVGLAAAGYDADAEVQAAIKRILDERPIAPDGAPLQ